MIVKFVPNLTGFVLFATFENGIGVTIIYLDWFFNGGKELVKAGVNGINTKAFFVFVLSAGLLNR